MSTWPTDPAPQVSQRRLNAREGVEKYGDNWRIGSGYGASDLVTQATREYCAVQVFHLHVRSREEIHIKHLLLAGRGI